MSIQSFIQSEKERLNIEFPSIEVHVLAEPYKRFQFNPEPDAVNRFLSASHARNLDRLIGMVESEMVPNHLIYDSNACPDCAKNAVLYRLKDTLSKELEQLK